MSNVIKKRILDLDFDRNLVYLIYVNIVLNKYKYTYIKFIASVVVVT